MNINEYLQQISLPNEYWTQVDDYNYWVSTRYRAVSSSKKQNAFKLIQVKFHQHSNRYFFLFCQQRIKKYCWLDEYLNPLMEKIKANREQEIRTLKQREFDAEVKRCVMFLLGDENHKDYDYYFKHISASKKACRGKSTCASIQG